MALEHLEWYEVLELLLARTQLIRPSLYMGRHGVYRKLATDRLVPLICLPPDVISSIGTLAEANDAAYDRDWSPESCNEPIGDAPMAEEMAAATTQTPCIEDVCDLADQHCEANMHASSVAQRNPDEPLCQSGDNESIALADHCVSTTKEIIEDECGQADPEVCRHTEIEVTSAAAMLLYLRLRSNRPLDVVRLRINLIWVAGDPLTAESMDATVADQIDLPTLQASRNQRDDPSSSLTKNIEPASDSKIQATLQAWLDVLDILCAREVKIEEVVVHWYGPEFCTSRAFVERLGKLKVAKQVTLRGTFSAEWPALLRAALNVNVFTADNSVLIPRKSAVGDAGDSTMIEANFEADVEATTCHAYHEPEDEINGAACRVEQQASCNTDAPLVES